VAKLLGIPYAEVVVRFFCWCWGYCREAIFEMSVKYSQTRVQFGVPIGRFQRVRTTSFDW
jgi:hypothetical protein